MHFKRLCPTDKGRRNGGPIRVSTSSSLPYGHPDSIADALSIFRRHRLCYIGVHCDLDVLEQRERERVDHNEGWARRQYHDLHDGAVYDIEVDTTMPRLDENADLIARYLAHRDGGLVATKQEPAV